MNQNAWLEFMLIYWTEQVGLSGNAFELYSGVGWLVGSNLVRVTEYLRSFVDFLSPSRQMMEYYHKLF
jgi:hypothetical protein